MTDKIRAALVDYRALAVTRLAIRDADEALREYDARATPALPEGMAIVPVERLKYLNDHHHATEIGVGLARLALSRGDTQRAIEALNSTSEKLDSILDVLAAVKEPATCSVCGLKRSDTKNCKAPDCSPILAAAKEKGE